VIRIQGTAPVERLDIVRNNRYLHTAAPGKEEVEITYRDMSPEKGLNYYYIRALQADGEVAWSSPVWVNFGR